MNYLTTLLDLCVDDKTAQTATKHEKGHTASQTTCFTKSCQHGSRTRADQQRHEDKNTNRQIFITRVFNTGSQGDTKNKTWEASTHAQYPRLIGLHRDVNDAHRAGANRLRNKTKSTLTGVLREQTRRDKKQSASLINVLSSQHGSQRCGNVA